VTAIILSQEFAASKERFQRTLMISLVLHAVLFAWLLLRQTISPISEGIVEIAWLDPAPVPSPPPPKPVQARPVPVPVAKPVIPSRTEEKFLRRQQPAVVEPTPQELTANRDMVKERLAALTPSKLPSSALTPVPQASSSLLKSAPVEAADMRKKASAVDLKREENSLAKPVPLKRGTVKSNRTAPALATVPLEKSVATAAMPDMESVSRRTLEGAELAGEIANRPVIGHTMPVYPEWAKTQAVEATVTLYFVVLPDGRVKENIQVQKTAGFSDFDRNAMSALAGWRFQALTGGAAHEQWGTITFRFRLRN
jgi:TonB family protein